MWPQESPSGLRAPGAAAPQLGDKALPRLTPRPQDSCLGQEGLPSSAQPLPLPTGQILPNEPGGGRDWHCYPHNPASEGTYGQDTTGAASECSHQPVGATSLPRSLTPILSQKSPGPQQLLPHAPGTWWPGQGQPTSSCPLAQYPWHPTTPATHNQDQPRPRQHTLSVYSPPAEQTPHPCRERVEAGQCAVSMQIGSLTAGQDHGSPGTWTPHRGQLGTDQGHYGSGGTAWPGLQCGA